MRRLSSEAIAKQAARREAREEKLEAEQIANEQRLAAERRKLKAERAQVINATLGARGHCGVMALRGADPAAAARFREGLDIALDGRLLVLPADGTIQGEPRDESFADGVIEKMNKHRHALINQRPGKKGVLGFSDVDFSGQSGNGTPRIANRVVELLTDAKERPGRRLDILALGEGEPTDMPTHNPAYRQYSHEGLVGELDVIFALDPHGKPRTVLELDTPEITLPSKIFGPFAHHVRSEMGSQRLDELI